MFGLSFAEVLVIMIVILVVVGPDKLPEVARTVGRTVWQMKHLLEELRREASLPSLDDIKRDLIAPPRSYSANQPGPQTAGSAILSHTTEDTAGQSAIPTPAIPTPAEPAAVGAASVGTPSAGTPKLPQPPLHGTCEESRINETNTAEAGGDVKGTSNDNTADC